MSKSTILPISVKFGLVGFFIAFTGVVFTFLFLSFDLFFLAKASFFVVVSGVLIGFFCLIWTYVKHGKDAFAKSWNAKEKISVNLFGKD